MLPTNVMSFMKKMVAPEDAPAQHTPDNTGTFGKLKQTLSSSLLTAQDKVTKMSPRPSLVPDITSDTTTATTTNESLTVHAQQQQTNQNSAQKVDPAKPPSRAGACRVCLKSFKPDDYSKTCIECEQRVCEDCATSYAEFEDPKTWRCSVCKRKMASRVCIPQDSTDSMLDVPVLEALQRRHSDVKLGSSVQLSTGNGLGLAPPRSPELRRHSDVSPASLKELEKLKGTKTPNDEWGKGRSTAPSRSSSPPRRGDFDIPPIRIGSRRQSRVARQHSYDDEIKIAGPGGGSQTDLGLGIPSIPRRASAYDVFAPGILAAAAQAAAQAGGAPPSRRASFRIAATDDMPQNDNSPSPDNGSPVLMVEEDRRMRRRGSQLPDIAALRDRGAIPTSINLTPTPFQPPALEDLEAPRRQTSMDGEAIKIVIHDVDSGPICASKRRVVLRRDPTDKAHR
ncbi:uncharacterized protein LOC119083089, partial [Bradysia coprophila]|uniref:uncharacterized protein LOC119083089 n=1 Tax=Bradysia coprophila TaxID=38358 RepID=UPI00187D6E83